MGTSQINHIIPALEERYRVVNLQKIIDERSLTKSRRLIAFVRALSDVDILYNVFTGPGFWRFACIAKLMGKRVATHWIGSDVRWACEGRTQRSALKMIDRHLVCFEPLQDDLRTFGVTAGILPIIPFNVNFEISSMPERHAALIYLPQGKEELYGLNELREVFPKFPEMPFYIVANEHAEIFEAYDNVTALGMLSLDEMDALYDKISVLIRIHLSDGLSMMVLEALGKGKRVIWDHAFPYVLPGMNACQIQGSLDSVISEPPVAQIEAHEYVKLNYNKSVFLDIFDRLVVD